MFKNSFIPQSLDDVVNIDRDFRQAKQGKTPIYTTIHGLKDDLSAPKTELVNLEEEEEKEASDNGHSSNSESENEEVDLNASSRSIHARDRDESPNTKKVNSFLF